MIKPLSIALLVALLAAGCAAPAKDAATIRYRVDVDPARRTATLTCTASSTGECVVWSGDARSDAHRAVRIAAGSSAEFSGDDYGTPYCANPVQAHLAWPSCIGSPTSGTLDKAQSRDDVFW